MIAVINLIFSGQGVPSGMLLEWSQVSQRIRLETSKWIALSHSSVS
jgi:hypothetical protein